MSKIYFDIDGVLRLLDIAVLGDSASEWIVEIDGLDFVSYVSRNPHLLLEAEPSEYVEVVKEEFIDDIIFFLTVQPEDWRPYTERWLENYFGDRYYCCIYCESPMEKLTLLSDGSLLFDDYPFEIEEFPKGLYTVTRPYNLRCKNSRRIDASDEMRNVIKKWREELYERRDL